MTDYSLIIERESGFVKRVFRYWQEIESALLFKESASIPVRLLESYFPSIRDKGFLLLFLVATPPKITTKVPL
jgi:hypothetical protein